MDAPRSPSVPSAPESPEGGLGLPRRRTNTTPGVAVPRYPAIDTSDLDADQAATVARVVIETLNRQLVHAAEELRDERLAHARSIRDAQHIHADLLRLIDAFHPATSTDAYELLAKMWAKYGGSVP